MFIIISVWNLGYKFASNILADILHIVWPQNQGSIRNSAENILIFAVSTPALRLFPQRLQRTKLDVDQSL